MKKVLFVATVAKTHIKVFHLPFLKLFKEMGWETSVAARNDFGSEKADLPYCDNYYDLPFERFPIKFGNIKAYKQLKKIIDSERFDIIHCHTPVGGLLARLAGRKARKTGSKIIYTAHGFHFYKGASKLNWLLFYPIERICARLTDVLITINQEDYALAQKKFGAKKIEYVPGVGVDLEKYGKTSIDKSAKRKELGIPDGVKLFLSVGELNNNKNHETVIRAISNIPDTCYIIAGQGPLKEYLQKLIDDLGVSDRVLLLGYRKDVAELCRAADVFVFPSFREGLSLSLMEAMGSGLPCVVSRIRGNVDLIDENGGVLFQPDSVEECKQALEKVLAATDDAMGEYNKEKVKAFSLEEVEKIMTTIYQEV